MKNIQFLKSGFAFDSVIQKRHQEVMAFKNKAQKVPHFPLNFSFLVYIFSKDNYTP